MNKPRTDIAGVFLAVTPVLFLCLRLPQALFMGALIVAAYWVTALFFMTCAPLFPSRGIKAAFLLWCAAWGQAGYYFFDLVPFWVISLMLLVPDGFFDESKDRPDISGVLFRGALFGALLIFTGGIQELLAECFSIEGFRFPMGSFLLLALAGLSGKINSALKAEQH